MKEIEFNLLTEPWIRVRLRDNTVREVSLTEALVSAQDYVDLAGEMPTQNAAVLRLLLAVLFTVFSRVDAKGEPRPLMQSDDALERWSAGARYGSWGISRQSLSGIIWSSGRTGFGCSTRHTPSGRCRRQRSARNTVRPNSTVKCRKAAINSGSFRCMRGRARSS